MPKKKIEINYEDKPTEKVEVKDILKHGFISEIGEIEIYKAGLPLFGCKHQNQEDNNSVITCLDCSKQLS